MQATTCTFIHHGHLEATTHIHALVFLQVLLCFQCNGCTAGVGQETYGVAVLSKTQQATRRAKNNIITATKELVKELKGDVPKGETPPPHNGVIHTFLRGE